MTISDALWMYALLVSPLLAAAGYCFYRAFTVRKRYAAVDISGETK